MESANLVNLIIERFAGRIIEFRWIRRQSKVTNVQFLLDGSEFIATHSVPRGLWVDSVSKDSHRFQCGDSIEVESQLKASDVQAERNEANADTKTGI